MSCGMTDKRSQPDEDDMTAKEDADALRGFTAEGSNERPLNDFAARQWGWQKTMAEHGSSALAAMYGVNMPEGWAKAIGPLPDRRAQALEMALKTFQDAGDHPEVTKRMLARAESFLAWLNGDVTEFCKAAEPASAAAPTSPAKTPAEMAEVGDVVEISDHMGIYHAPVAIIDDTNDTDRSDSIGRRLGVVLGNTPHKYWPLNGDVKRIVRKAAEAGK